MILNAGLKERWKKIDNLFENNLISRSDKDSIISSYIGHLSYGDCNDLLYRNIHNTLCSVSMGIILL